MTGSMTTEAIEVLPAQEYRRERWPNGGGWTRQIASARDEGSGLLWRLSIAEITSDADYSRFPGLDRHQVLLQGEGIALEVEGAPVRRVEPPFGEASFPGHLAVRCTLLGGPVHMFNLFHRPDRFETSLWRRPLVGAMYFFPAADEIWALHLLSGQAELEGGGAGHLLEQGDTALLGSSGTAAGRVSLEGGGEVLVARLRQRHGAG
jgi:uncharacterized protein